MRMPRPLTDDSGRVAEANWVDGSDSLREESSTYSATGRHFLAVIRCFSRDRWFPGTSVNARLTPNAACMRYATESQLNNRRERRPSRRRGGVE
jgi:hypothetical protein